MSTPGATFDLMAEACSKAAVLLRINGIPTIISINELVKATKQVATSLNTRMWGGNSRLPSPCPRGGRDTPRCQQPHTQLQQGGEAALHAPGNNSLDHRHCG